MSEEDKKEEMAGEECPEENQEEQTPDETEVLKARVRELEDEVSALKDTALREAAENENFRKRMRADKENAVRYANESLIKDLLEPLDNFSRAIEAASSSADAEALRTGVVMVEDQMMTMLKNNWGLEVYSPEGEKFDPSEMEACSVVEQEGLDSEKVVQVFTRGYKLHGRVIRSARVVVGRPVSGD